MSLEGSVEKYSKINFLLKMAKSIRAFIKNSDYIGEITWRIRKKNSV